MYEEDLEQFEEILLDDIFIDEEEISEEESKKYKKLI